MTQANSQPTSARPIDPASDPDPLMHLHKMSTTAGLGSQEYVAVNTTAVVAVLFAVASILAVFGSILLVIPVVGVILSIIALRQVGNSNGTQTGRGIAYLALALSAIITAGVFAKQGIDYLHSRSDLTAIKDLCNKYGTLLKEKKFDQAYDLFDDAFRQRIPLEQFKEHFDFVQNGSGGRPTIDSVASNGLAEFSSEDEVEIASSWMIVLFTTGQDWREPARFKKQNGVWKIDNLSSSFPPPEAKRRGRD